MAENEGGYDARDVQWHLPTILRWIDENRTATHTPGGTLVGEALRVAAERMESLAYRTSLIGRLEAKIEAVQRVIEGGYRRVTADGATVNPLKNGEQCVHGRREWEDCIGCYDDALLDALNPDPPSPSCDVARVVDGRGG